MMNENYKKPLIGWIGTGRMGYPMAERMAAAGHEMKVWNRTRAKAESLAFANPNVTVVDDLQDIAGCEVVFTMIATDKDLLEVLFGKFGLFNLASTPKILVDCSSVSVQTSTQIRSRLAESGIEFLAAPVSGNGKSVKYGMCAIVSSGPQSTFNNVQPFLNAIAGKGASYVGDGENARVVKICHNVFLGVVTQSLSELTVLAEKSGVPRHQFLEFINRSVMGSTYTRYKTPGWVNQDYTVTFTPELMRKDMDLGLELSYETEVPLPLASISRDLLQASMGHGYRKNVDFSIIMDFIAKCASLLLKPENKPVNDGLSLRASDA